MTLGVNSCRILRRGDTMKLIIPDKILKIYINFRRAGRERPGFVFGREVHA